MVYVKIRKKTASAKSKKSVNEKLTRKDENGNQIEKNKNKRESESQKERKTIKQNFITKRKGKYRKS